MARYVTKYESKDGRLWDTNEDADRWDIRNEILRLLIGTEWPCEDGDGLFDEETTVTWIVTHLKTLADVYNYPSIAKDTVDEALGIKPEPPSTVAATECGKHGWYDDDGDKCPMCNQVEVEGSGAESPNISAEVCAEVEARREEDHG